MNCIVEPCTDHPISGGYLYNKALERVGAVMRITTLDPSEAFAKAKGCLLFDSLFLQAEGDWLEREPQRSAWLIHSLPQSEGPWLQRLCAFSQLVVTSQAVARKVRALSPQSRVIVCEPGLEELFHEFHPLAPVYGDLRILSVANVLPGKGFLEALPFLDELSRSFSQWRWLIAGSERVDPPYSALFREAIRQRGWEGRVEFHGLMNPRQGLYQTADLFLSFSRAETFGMAIQEASALGLPMLCTDVGISPEILSQDPWSVILPLEREMKMLPEVLALLVRLLGERRPLRTTRKHRLLQRSWEDAGRELQEQLTQC